MRSEYLFNVIKRYASKKDTILEIGCGDYRHVNYLKERGYNVEGIDKIYGTAIEDVEPKKYDIIYTMSTLFLIRETDIPVEEVFKKIANMANKYIITIEGEASKENGVVGREYDKVFSPFGFKEVECAKEVFNIYGVMRVLKNGKLA